MFGLTLDLHKFSLGNTNRSCPMYATAAAARLNTVISPFAGGGASPRRLRRGAPQDGTVHRLYGYVGKAAFEKLGGFLYSHSPHKIPWCSKLCPRAACSKLYLACVILPTSPVLSFLIR